MACSIDLLALWARRDVIRNKAGPQDKSLDNISQLKAISLKSLGSLRRDSLGQS